MADPANNIQTYRQMLKVDRRSRVFALLAEELCAAGQWEEAAEVCKKGLLFHPDHLRSRVLLGCAFMEMGEADQSERILLGVVDDIRRNSIAFKLLSEFATFSGDPKSAEEYARIYEVLQTTGAAPGANASPPELDRMEEVFPPEKEAIELDDFKAEDIEDLQGASMDAASAKTSAQPAPQIESNNHKVGLEDVLAQLVQRIEGRFPKRVLPGAILSEDDKSMLKQKIVEALGA
jgi:tetratricopeptide (TPR) repeat protein